MEKHLPEGFELVSVDPKGFWDPILEEYKKAFNDRRSNDIVGMLSDSEKENLRKNREIYPQQHSFGFYLKHQSRIIGWHFGDVKDQEIFYMRNSAIIAEYRGQGLYEKMLLEILEIIQGKGFQVVTSTHHSNNPGVIIPKLRQGFVISGSELHERFGFLIHMKYFFNEKRRKSYDAQIGLESS